MHTHKQTCSCKHLEIAAYLKSIKCDFISEEEEAIVAALEKTEKLKLKQAMVPYFHAFNNSHILYLTSKSRTASADNTKDFKDLMKLYEELDTIEEISPILKVVQHSVYLDIIFDFENDNNYKSKS